MSHRLLFKWSHSSNQQFSGYNRTAFSTLHQPESATYHLLLNACLQQCKKLKTRYLFEEMPQRLSHVSKVAKLVHSHSLKLGISSEGSLGNAILDLYAKCGHLDFAGKTFHRLENRNVLSWNSILSMYSKHGFPHWVLQKFGLLWNCGEWPNEFTFAIVLSACGKLETVECGRQLHCGIVKLGFEWSSRCNGSLTDMYAKCGFLSDARIIFDGAIDLDTVSWTSMIGGYVRAGLPEEAVNLFERMKKAGREPDEVAFLTVLNAYARLGRLDDASELFLQMRSKNVVAWNMMISGHAHRGNVMEAVEFFGNMRKEDIKSTRSTLGSVLSAIASLAALDFGLVVHAEAIKQGLHSNVYVGSSLISMYTKCGKMEAAKKVFDDLNERNVVLWNAMLQGYTQNGFANKVMELFFKMKSCGFRPDEFTYSSLLSACACLQHLELGRQLHSIIIKNLFSSNVFVGNALVDMYAKSGALKDARQQFELMRNRDHVSWNAIIVGYVQGEEEVEAFHLFRRMNSQGNLSGEVSLASILSACANIKAFESGEQAHCLLVKSGLETSLYAGSSLVGMYAKCGAVEAAHKVLTCMPEHNVVSMNALIAGYAAFDVERSIMLFQEMQLAGLKPSEITFASLLDACDGPQTLILGKQIHCLILRWGHHLDDEFLGVSLLGMYMNSFRKADAIILFSEILNPKGAIIWTALISGLTQNDCSTEALQFYEQMRIADVLPDQATFVSVLRACAVSSSTRVGREIHSLIFHTGFDLDEVTCSSLVDMYAKCGDVRSSLQVFEEMNNKNDVISWNSMIVGFAKNGYAKEALRIFDMMKQTHVLPDEVTFLGVLTACSHAGMVSEGRQIFDIMVNCYGVQPKVDHYACMVDLLGRWGFLEEAEDFINKLKFEPDSKIWATMLGACRIHGDEARGQQAAQKLIQLEPQSSSPYVLLSNIYATTGNWDEVNSLRREMKVKGVKKFPGCSWIMVKQETNLFVAGDKSHPCAAEIHAILKDLTMLIKENYSADIDLLIQD